MVNKKKYRKVVEWEKDEFGFWSSWILMIFITIFFPITYILQRRNVHYELIKQKEDLK